MSAETHTHNGHFTAAEFALDAEADAEALRLSSDWVAWQACKRRGRVSTADYLAGGLPLAWLARAARLSAGAGMVAVMLWHLRNLQKSCPATRRPQPTVRLEPQHYATFGVHRNTVHRALAAMEQQGLVGVRQGPGHPPEVTLMVGPCGGSYGT